jgi:hypothetical protein
MLSEAGSAQADPAQSKHPYVINNGCPPHKAFGRGHFAVAHHSHSLQRSTFLTSLRNWGSFQGQVKKFWRVVPAKEASHAPRTSVCNRDFYLV